MQGEKRDRVESDESSVEPKRVRLDSPVLGRKEFLEILEEEVDNEPQIQGIESVIRSLEEEINPAAAADMMELGYLLEASDDELGLPPAEGVNSQTVDLIGVVDSEIAAGDDSAGSFLAIDGLFEYGGGGVEDSDLPEFQWRPETMPAL